VTIHDHFHGSAHCVECGGPCNLIGEDRGVTEFVRFTLERLVFNGWKKLPDFEREALLKMGVDADALWKRALDVNEGQASAMRNPCLTRHGTR